MNNRISVTPLTSTIGARVDGIDLREDMNEEVSEQLRQALWDHHVLVVPNQQVGLDGQNRLTTQVADPLPAYVGNPARAFEKMLDPANGLTVSLLRVVAKDGTTTTERTTLRFTLTPDPKITNPGG